MQISGLVHHLKLKFTHEGGLKSDPDPAQDLGISYSAEGSVRLATGLVRLWFCCSTLCLVLPGLMGNWQKWQSRLARWGNIPNQSQPNPVANLTHPSVWAIYEVWASKISSLWGLHIPQKYVLNWICQIFWYWTTSTSFQVHMFELYFARTLVAAWLPKRKAQWDWGRVRKEETVLVTQNWIEYFLMNQRTYAGNERLRGVQRKHIFRRIHFLTGNTR